MPQKIYPRSKDKETVYLKGVVSNPNISGELGVPGKEPSNRYAKTFP